MKKIDFFPREIETTTPILFDQAWSRASKKVGVVVSIASNCEKSAAQGAENGRFCMGILVTLSLSKKKAPIGIKIFFVDKVDELKFKRIGRKSLQGLQSVRWRFATF